MLSFKVTCEDEHAAFYFQFFFPFFKKPILIRATLFVNHFVNFVLHDALLTYVYVSKKF